MFLYISVYLLCRLINSTIRTTWLKVAPSTRVCMDAWHAWRVFPNRPRIYADTRTYVYVRVNTRISTVCVWQNATRHPNIWSLVALWSNLHKFNVVYHNRSCTKRKRDHTLKGPYNRKMSIWVSAGLILSYAASRNPRIYADVRKYTRTIGERRVKHVTRP